MCAASALNSGRAPQSVRKPVEKIREIELEHALGGGDVQHAVVLIHAEDAAAEVEARIGEARDALRAAAAVAPARR